MNPDFLLSKDVENQQKLEFQITYFPANFLFYQVSALQLNPFFLYFCVQPAPSAVDSGHSDCSKQPDHPAGTFLFNNPLHQILFSHIINL